jgi:hypothetical protein
MRLDRARELGEPIERLPGDIGRPAHHIDDMYSHGCSLHFTLSLRA